MKRRMHIKLSNKLKKVLILLGVLFLFLLIILGYKRYFHGSVKTDISKYTKDEFLSVSENWQKLVDEGLYWKSNETDQMVSLVYCNTDFSEGKQVSLFLDVYKTPLSNEQVSETQMSAGYERHTLFGKPSTYFSLADNSCYFSGLLFDTGKIDRFYEILDATIKCVQGNEEH